MGEKKKTEFWRSNTSLKNYMAYPKFLLATDISETAKMIYVLLLERVRQPVGGNAQADENGNVYILYPIEQLVQASGKSKMTVKNALKSLEEEGLIFRERQMIGLPTRIYVKTRTETYPTMWTGNYTLQGQKAVPNGDRKRATKENNGYGTDNKRDYSYGDGESL